MKNILYSKFHIPRSEKGFTVLELLVFAAIFSATTVAFITIFVAITRVQTRQAGASEVNQQSQFLLQQIQYYAERSSLIDVPYDSATSTLKLRMASAAEEPTYIFASGTTAYLQQTVAGAPQALTSGKVNVTNLLFTRHANPPGHDSVSVSFTVAYNTSNLEQRFSEALNTSIARVSAATFDSNVVPSSTATYNLGVTNQIWSSVNNVIYFSGANVGINTASPHRALEISAGDVYIDTAGNQLIIHDPTGAYCWFYKPTAGTGAWSYSSSTCP